MVAGAGGLEPILNVLTGTVAQSPDHTGYALVRCGKQELKVPRGDLRTGQTVTIALPARDIILSLTHPHGISARNTFPAVVRRTEQNGHALWVSVEAGGNSFIVELTEAAGRELAIGPGMDIHVVTKAHSIAVTPIIERRHHERR